MHWEGHSITYNIIPQNIEYELTHEEIGKPRLGDIQTFFASHAWNVLLNV